MTLGKLRILSGLSFEQLAIIFNMTVQEINFWISGKAQIESKEQQLQRLAHLFNKIDRGSASDNKLLYNNIIINLLLIERYEEVFQLLGPGKQRKPVTIVSNETLELRKPPPPEMLVGALQNNVSKEIGRFRPAKTVKVKKEY